MPARLSWLKSVAEKGRVLVFEPGGWRVPGMLYEEKVTSFSELAKRLRVMDQDAGVRLIGGYGRKEFLVFVTRFGTKFTMMRYSMTQGSRTPGRRLETLELETFEQLKTALRKIVHGRVRAWIY